MNNLLVSHIELRTEDSIDIKPYTHERKVEKVVVPLGEELSSIKEQYIQVSGGNETNLKRTPKLIKEIYCIMTWDKIVGRTNKC